MLKKLKYMKRALSVMTQLCGVNLEKSQFGHFADDAYILGPAEILNHRNVFLYEHTHIMGGCHLLVTRGKFVMKHHSCAAQNLLILTGSHVSKPGTWFLTDENRVDDFEADVTVEEDAWIGANVTLMPGVTIGRGAIVGAGSVVRTDIPPYSVVTGNPAKVIGFRFNPLEVMEHEKRLYPENERLAQERLMSDYQHYYYDRMEAINDYLNVEL